MTAIFLKLTNWQNLSLMQKNDGLDIICQCEYGESRSSGCAAAILEYFYKTGNFCFTDYRYYPNQVIYHKVFDALSNYPKRMHVPKC